MMSEFHRKVSVANKVHKCANCGDPIVSGDEYTSFTPYTFGRYGKAIKACNHCEPILKYEGRTVTQELAREIKHGNAANTWNSVVQLFGFESYADFDVYLRDATPAWHTKS